MRVHLPLSPLAVACACWLVLGSAPSLMAQQLRLTLLDGRQVESEVTGMAASGELQGPRIPAGLDLDGLRRFESTGSSQTTSEPKMLVELHGGQVHAADATVADEKLSIAWGLGEPLVVPIDQVRAIRFELGKSQEVFDEALANPSTEHDRLFVKIDDRLQSLQGLVEKIDAKNVVFEFDGQKRTLARDQLYGIVVAQFETAAKQQPKCRLTLGEGDWLTGNPTAIEDGKLEFELKGGVAASVPLSAIERAEIRSSRLAFLSDLEPIEVDEAPLVTFAKPWRRDRSVAGGVLSLPQHDESSSQRTVRRFDKGLGVHARSRLTFEVEDGFDQFAAVIGIDAETQGRGDCEFVVLADGREVYRQRVRGDDAPRDVKLDIAGVKRLTLLVEPGEELDLADHADWGDARLLKDAAK